MHELLQFERHPTAVNAALFLIGAAAIWWAGTRLSVFADAIADRTGFGRGIVGTVGARIAGAPVSLGHTTPEATVLQRLLRQMVDAGVEIAALEVSSHALAMGRADAMRFDVVAFTNLTQDHLDFHGDMEAYFAAKRLLFAPARAQRLRSGD